MTNDLRQDLLNLGVTKAGADHFSDLFSADVIERFSFMPVQTAFYPDVNIAERAFRRLCTEIKGKHFSEFELRLIRTNTFHTDFFSERLPQFTADGINFLFCSLSEAEQPFLAECLRTSKAKRIVLADVSMGNSLPAFGNIAAENGVSDLSLSLYSPHTGIREFANGLNRAPLEKLSLYLADIHPNEAKPLIEGLPPSLKILTLSDMPLKYCARDVANSIARMKELHKLNLMSGGLTDEGLQSITAVLPSSLNGLTVYKQPDVTDRSAGSVLDFMYRKDVFATAASLKTTSVSQEMQDAITNAADENKRTLEAVNTARRKSNSANGLITQAALDKASKPEDVKKLLIDAAEIGLLPEALNKLKTAGGKLTAEEVKRKDGMGRSVLSAAVEQRQAFLIFDSALWSNVKEMQVLHDALNEYGKRQIGGHYGYPSYQKAKNEIMSAAVRQAVARKDRSE